MTDIHFQSIVPHDPIDNRTVLTVPGERTEDVREVAQTIVFLAGSGNVTISGEPFRQPDALYELLIWLRGKGIKHIIVHSSCAWEYLYRHHMPILWMIDVLVDGPDSRRPVDVLATLIGDDPLDPMVLDWSGQVAIETQ